MKKLLVTSLTVMLLAGLLRADPYFRDDFVDDPFSRTVSWTRSYTGSSSVVWSGSTTESIWLYSPDKDSQANAYSPTISGQGTEYVVTVKFKPSYTGTYEAPTSDNFVYILEPMTTAGSQRDITVGLSYTSGTRNPRLAIRSTVGSDIWAWSYQDAVIPLSTGTSYEVKYVRTSGSNIVHVWARQAGSTWVQLKNSADSYDFSLVGGQPATSTFDKLHVGYANNSSRYQVYLEEVVISPKPAAAPVCGITWYDSLSTAGGTVPADLVNTGCNRIILTTTMWGSNLMPYLDDAEAKGIDIILVLSKSIITGSNLASYVNNYEDKVSGWYIADEPSWHGESPSQAEVEAAYTIIKNNDDYDNPVYIAFSYTDLLTGALGKYKNGYDVMLYDCQYPCFKMTDEETPVRTPEYYWIDDDWVNFSREFWKSKIDRAHVVALECGKPFEVILQAFGTDSWRLPTYNEIHFMQTYAILSGARDLLFWSYHALIASDEDYGNPPNDPGALYPYDGLYWFNDVAKRIMAEQADYAYAIDAGKIHGALCDPNDVPWGSSVMTGTAYGIHAGVYKCPYTGKYFLLSVNPLNTSKTVTFDILLPGDWSHLKAYSDGSHTAISTADRVIKYVNDVPVTIPVYRVTLSYGAHEVKNFELVPLP